MCVYTLCCQNFDFHFPDIPVDIPDIPVDIPDIPVDVTI